MKSLVSKKAQKKSGFLKKKHPNFLSTKQNYQGKKKFSFFEAPEIYKSRFLPIF
jgi:hypothetical protein